jgi:hypothetical protein
LTCNSFPAKANGIFPSLLHPTKGLSGVPRAESSFPRE